MTEVHLATWWRAAGTATVLLVALASCGRVGAAAGGCEPEDLVWVYSRVVDPEDHGHPTDVFRLHGGDETALTGDGAASAPSVSPDGERIVFRRGSEGDPESAGYSRYRLYTVDAAGGDEQPLLEPAHEITPGAGIAWDTAPAWSPDGSWIAFVRYHDVVLGEDDPSDTRAVMVVPATGGAPRALPGTGTDLHDPAPAWSADSTRLAWTTSSPDLLHWSDRDGGSRGQARLPGRGGTPAWSTGGDAVLVPVASERGSPVLYRVALPSGDLTRLEVSMSGIWRLPTGELAGVEPDGDRGRNGGTIVVVDLGAGDTAGRDRREIGAVGGEVDVRRAPVNAVPADAGGWASCP